MATEPAARPLKNARVLVVDDEFLIAAQLQCDLHEAGAQVIGPSHTLKDALALAEREHPTAAILDIQLGHDNMDRSRGTLPIGAFRSFSTPDSQILTQSGRIGRIPRSSPNRPRPPI
jgi:ActR/RegA family two-component response regulator